MGKRRFFCAASAAMAALVVFVSPFTSQAQTVPFPTASGSGYFNYDGSALTLTTMTKITMVFYTPTESAFFSWQDPAVDAVMQLTGVNQVGSTYAFTDGSLSLTTPGGDVLLAADIIDTLLVPTSEHTGTINAGLAAINLCNVVVNQPQSGSSRFVTDWITASEGTGLGAIGLSLTNTASGSIDPLAAPASGSATFTLQPAVPEPATLLFMLMGVLGWTRRRR